MKIENLDTPSLLIDREIMRDNMTFMLNYAARRGVKLRPHTKTHKMAAVARLQVEMGASGIAVAKVGEAEAMADAGLDDIFIANEIVGAQKWERIRALAQRGVKVSFGIDSPEVLPGIQNVFAGAASPAEVMVEIEVGERRSGVVEESGFAALLAAIRQCPAVRFKGIFSHDGNSYSAKDREELVRIAVGAQERTLRFARLAAEAGMPCEAVSYGATPTFMNEVPILGGITELRPGTFIFMDASQAHAVGTLTHCAAAVLATVISRPTAERVILDVGAKGLTMQRRSEGVCATPGHGTLLEYPGVHIDKVFDEHAIINDAAFREKVRVGERVRIIPVHICPVCNLYEYAYLVSGGEVIDRLPVSARGKLQ